MAINTYSTIPKGYLTFKQDQNFLTQKQAVTERVKGIVKGKYTNNKINLPHYISIKVNEQTLTTRFTSLARCSLLLTTKYKYIKNVSFNIHMNMLTHRQLATLNYAFKHLTQLTHLHLNFTNYNEDDSLTDQQFEMLIHSISALKGLKSLRFKLVMCTQLSDKSLSYLSNKLPYLQQLQDFQLMCIPPKHELWSGVPPLIASLSKLPELKSVTLQIYPLIAADEQTQQKMSEFSADLTQLKHIKSLNLIFNEKPTALNNHNLQVSASPLHLLGPTIQEFTTLKQLALNLCFVEPHQTSLTPLNHALTKLPALTSFQLNINCLHLDCDSLSKFFTTLKNHPQLHNLDLILSQANRFKQASFIPAKLNTGLTEHHLQSLTQVLIQHSNSLQNLRLAFNLNRSSLEPISILQPSLGKLTQLTSLLLNFDYCSTIDKTNLSDLMTSISRLQQLTRVSLSFVNSSVIHPETLIKVLEKLDALPNLTQITVTLPNNFELNAKHVNQIIGIINKF